MNFLAHAVCTDGPDGVVFAAIMSDLFSRQTQEGFLPEGVKDGRKIHRLQDRLFNSTTEMAPIRSGFHDIVGHYHDPVLDVVCDYVLASAWPFNEKLSFFTREVYGIIEPRIHLLAPERQIFARMMISHDVLASYHTKDGLRAALNRLAVRSKRGYIIADALPDIIGSVPNVEQIFLSVLPIIHEESQTTLRELGYQIEEPLRLHWKEGVLSKEGRRRPNKENI